jgi:hypothetical protein
MRLHIEIDMDGAAFEDRMSTEAGRVLQDVTRRLNLYDADEVIEVLDSNGNTCGRAWTTED